MKIDNFVISWCKELNISLVEYQKRMIKIKKEHIYITNLKKYFNCLFRCVKCEYLFQIGYDSVTHSNVYRCERLNIFWGHGISQCRDNINDSCCCCFRLNKKS